jgi:hypothetical protein
MVCRGWPGSGFSQVARNIRVAGAKRTPSVKGLLRDMQIARLALFEVNEKMPERRAATKGARTNAHNPGTARLYVVSGFTGWTTGFPDHNILLLALGHPHEVFSRFDIQLGLLPRRKRNAPASLI